MAKTTPTKRSLDELKRLGFVAGVVERRIPFNHVTVDLFNIIDVVAMLPGVGIVGVQATGGSGGNHAARRTKILAEPRARTWIESGGILEIWSWAKQGAAGKRKLWTLRRERIALEDTVTP